MWAKVTPNGDGYAFEELEAIPGGGWQPKPNGRTGIAHEANGQQVTPGHVARLWEADGLFTFFAGV